MSLSCSRLTLYCLCVAEAASVSHIAPPTGPTSGSTIVTLTGRNFFSGAYIKFGSVGPVAATVATCTQLRVLAPAHTAAAVAVELSNNNQDYTTSSALYVFVVPHLVSAVLPASGPATGGTVVTVTGSSFVATPLLACRFDSTVLSATYVSASVLMCVSPSHAAGAVNMSVANNNQDFIAYTGFTFYGVSISLFKRYIRSDVFHCSTTHCDCAVSHSRSESW